MPFFVAVWAAITQHSAAEILLISVILFIILWAIVTADRQLDKRVPILYPGVFFSLLAIIANSVGKTISKNGIEWKGRTLQTDCSKKDENEQNN